MKVSSLIAWLNDGTLHSVVSETFGPIDELAGVVRKERAIQVGKKQIPVIQALVVQANGGDAKLVDRIMCAADARREQLEREAKAKVAADAKAAKAKADDVK